MGRKKRAAPAAGAKSEPPRPAGGAARSNTVMIAVIAFCVGFLCGVGFAVYRSVPGTAPGAQSTAAPPPSDDFRQQEGALLAEANRNPRNAVTWAHLGNLYFDNGLHEKAIDAYLKSLELVPDNANVLTDLGVMYRRSGRPQQAVESFDRAIAADPKHETSRFNKGIVLLHDLKDTRGAVDAWEGLVAINPVAVTPSGQSVDEMVTQIKKQAGKP